ncbi:hypothetical protein, partial [Pantoea sp. GbtcB22]|uniref:hypothetical protein n=1 Tax=Pantoea sp. GbtcB22 TaxID=2824767 RepID=UPI001C30D197
MKFIENEEAATLARGEKRNGTQQQETQTQARSNSDLPPDLVGTLGDGTKLNMNAFVTPSGGQVENMTP